MNKNFKFTNMWVPALFLLAFVAGCGSSNSTTSPQTPTDNSAKAISSYSLDGASGLIDESDKSISITMPFGTDMSGLVATYITTGESVEVGEIKQISASTANDFSSAVVYTVTAADSTTATYTATATAAAADAKAIATFSINGAAGTIDELTGTIVVPVAAGTDVTNLVPTFTTTGTFVDVGNDEQASGSSAIDFTDPVIYRVYDYNNDFVDYTVTLVLPLGPMAVNLGTAGNFVILAKSAVTTTGTTAVTGDVGLSPAAASAYEGFGLIADSTNTFATSPVVTGSLYASNYATPTPATMTTAVADMETAFSDAAGRTLPDFTELGSGDISGMTLVPGLYKWGTGVLLTSAGVTLEGGANDVWIFQIAANLTVENSAMVTLAGGAQAKNIFWQVAGQATLGTAADFKGIILSQTLISLNTGAIMNGRALAQTAVTLNATAITEPAL